MSARNPHRLYDVTVSPVTVNSEDLRHHARQGDAGSLVAALAQITGDTAILDKFGPLLTTSDRPAFSGVATPRDLPSDALEEVIGLLEKELAAGNESREYVQVFDSHDFRRALEVATGELPGEEFVPVIQEQAGFLPSAPFVPRDVEPSERHKVLILGSGMSGIGAAIAVGDAGFEYEIYEAADDIGGTWRINTYPGVAVDTPSIYYSFSFELKTDWSRSYPLGAEYQSYLRHVVEKYGVKQRIHFNTRIEALHWDDDAQEWEVTATSNGAVTTSRFKFVITATGFLTRPSYPDVPGRETFEGLSLHSTEWTEDVDVRGKRVAVVGAGATAVQIVDAIFEEVEHLTLVQRQPHWISPNNLTDGGRIPESELWLLQNVPFYAKWQRAKTYWFVSDRNYGAIRLDYEWMKDNELSISRENHAMLQFNLGHLETSFAHDPEKKAKLTPNFPPFGKRPVRDPGGYYAALASEKSDIVTAPLEAVEPTGLRTSDGLLTEADVIVWATGFHLDYLSHLDIVGRDGVRLAEQWDGGGNPSTYLGGTVPNFPNFFVTSAPNSGNGHGGGHNFMTEVAQHYIVECMQLVVNAGAESIEVKEEVERDHLERMNERFKDSIWMNNRGAHTYYRNAQGRVVLPNPWRMVDNWTMNREPEPDEFIIR